MKFSLAILAGVATVFHSGLVLAQYDDAEAVLGPDPNGCNWKIALICASSLVGCGATCGAAIAEGGLNPFIDGGCASCVGTSAGICAMCWNDTDANDENVVCYAAENYNEAGAPGVPDACTPPPPPPVTSAVSFPAVSSAAGP